MTDAGGLPLPLLTTENEFFWTSGAHFHRYGTTRETLGWIALNQRANAESSGTRAR